jgi:hypothetical protein
VKRNKVMVSKTALLRRINRWLKKEKQKMFKVRRPFGKPNPRAEELGAYFIVRGSSIVDRKVDIESFAREHGVLAPYEAVTT